MSPTVRIALIWVGLPILLFVIGLTVLTALLAGIIPALKVSRTDVSSVLKDESRGSSSFQIGRTSRALVTAEGRDSFAATVLRKLVLEISGQQPEATRFAGVRGLP